MPRPGVLSVARTILQCGDPVISLTSPPCTLPPAVCVPATLASLLFLEHLQLAPALAPLSYFLFSTCPLCRPCGFSPPRLQVFVQMTCPLGRPTMTPHLQFSPSTPNPLYPAFTVFRRNTHHLKYAIYSIYSLIQGLIFLFGYYCISGA